jgi:ribosomal protein S27E
LATLKKKHYQGTVLMQSNNDPEISSVMFPLTLNYSRWCILYTNLSYFCLTSIYLNLPAASAIYPQLIHYKDSDAMISLQCGFSQSYEWIYSQKFCMVHLVHQEEDTAEPPPKVLKRCRLWGRAKNRVTTMRCSSCNDFVCKEHSATEVKCDTCANPAADESVTDDE